MTLAHEAMRLPETLARDDNGVRERMLSIAHALAAKMYSGAVGAAAVELTTEGIKAVTGAQ